MKEYALKVTIEALRVIAAGLQELPYRLAAPVLNALQAQVNEQDAAEAAKPCWKANEKAPMVDGGPLKPGDPSAHF